LNFYNKRQNLGLFVHITSLAVMHSGVGRSRRIIFSMIRRTHWTFFENKAICWKGNWSDHFGNYCHASM